LKERKKASTNSGPYWRRESPCETAISDVIENLVRNS
jgi:hypothetical protein